MGLPRTLLGTDEQIVFHLRTHVKRILGSLLIGLVLVLAAIAGTLFVVPLVPESAKAPVAIGLWIVTAALLVPIAVVPWLRWHTSTYTITDRRIITRQGVLNKRGHDIPLARISNVSYERGLVDRLFGCGTLILQTSAEVPLTLDDIPRVEHVHVTMTELLFRLGNTAPNA